jgi:hypothetical protein
MKLDVEKVWNGIDDGQRGWLFLKWRRISGADDSGICMTQKPRNCQKNYVIMHDKYGTRLPNAKEHQGVTDKHRALP